jgi:putative endonuclease
MTTDLKQRLKEHNEGRSPHTSKFRPWKLITYIAFKDRAKAEAFERYLKSGSGHAFASKRLWQSLERESRMPSLSSRPIEKAQITLAKIFPWKTQLKACSPPHRFISLARL